MADSSYPYPPDQFDREAEQATFHGAHRAEEPFWKQNLAYIIVIAVAFVTLLILLFAINGLGGGSDDTPAATTTTSAPASSKASDDGKKSEKPTAKADKSTPVLVINAGGINGMAGRWEDELTDDGWSDVGIATADSRQEQPVVFYKDDKDQATAEKLAEEVGADEARQSDEYDNRITFLAVTDPSDDDD